MAKYTLVFESGAVVDVDIKSGSAERLLTAFRKANLEKNPNGTLKIVTAGGNSRIRVASLSAIIRR